MSLGNRLCPQHLRDAPSLAAVHRPTCHGVRVFGLRMVERKAGEERESSDSSARHYARAASSGPIVPADSRTSVEPRKHCSSWEWTPESDLFRFRGSRRPPNRIFSDPEAVDDLRIGSFPIQRLPRNLQIGSFPIPRLPTTSGSDLFRSRGSRRPPDRIFSDFDRPTGRISFLELRCQLRGRWICRRAGRSWGFDVVPSRSAARGTSGRSTPEPRSAPSSDGGGRRRGSSSAHLVVGILELPREVSQRLLDECRAICPPPNQMPAGGSFESASVGACGFDSLQMIGRYVLVRR